MVTGFISAAGTAVRTAIAPARRSGRERPDESHLAPVPPGCGSAYGGGGGAGRRVLDGCVRHARGQRRPGKKIVVVAAENFWGSIASQLGGTPCHVTSIITNPDTDPHDYEPTAGDARTIAGAQLVIVNGIGYDPWAPKLLAANPVPGRRRSTSATCSGSRPGDNPHQWYSPPTSSR